MSYILPNSTMYVYTRNNIGQIPFDINHENTVIFSSKQEQESYFYNAPHIELSNQSYQRVNKGIIKIAPPMLDDNAIDTFCDANYLAFKNTSFENKWFYAFVDRAEYINNNTVMLFYHIDVIQTYMFDWIFNQCLIEREHTTDDNFGKYTIPEGLETGPYRSYLAECNLEDPRSPTGLAYMYNRFEYIPCIVLACAFDANNLSWSSEFDNVIPGVLVPGIANETGRYYSGIRYFPYSLYNSGEPIQGIYSYQFSGVWQGGQHLYFDGSPIYITAEAAQSNAALAQYFSDYVNQMQGVNYSAYVPEAGTVQVYEQQGHYGAGMPHVTTDNTSGGILSRTIQEGSASGTADVDRLNAALVEIGKRGRQDAIAGLFMMPYEFFPKTADELINGCPTLNMRVTAPTTIDGYTPRNKKLLCYPYNILYETNNSGNVAEYRYEEFLNLTSQNQESYVVFRLWGNISMNPGMYSAPHRYNGSIWSPGAIDDELVVTGFPMCSYNIDSFRAWLAQNSGTIAAGVGSIVASWATFIGGAIGAAGAVGGAAGANGAGALIPAETGGSILNMQNVSQAISAPKVPGIGLIGSTLGAIGQLYDHARTPPQMHGSNNGNLLYQAGQLTFSWYYKQIKQEYAKIIDGYFDMYGYKTNRVGTPNLMARPKYSYVKTIGCSLEGFIPGDFKSEIEAIFDKGIRFWRTGAVFGNFDPSVNNNMPV